MFFFLALSLDALAVPAQTLVAEGLGGDDPAGVRRIAGRVVVLSIWTAVSIAAVVAVTSPFVARLFSTDPEVVGRATAGLLLLAVLLVPGAIAFAYDGVLIGAGDYRFLGRAAFGYLLAVAPIAVVVLAAPGLGIAGIWVGLVFWMVIRATVNDRRAVVVMAR